MSVASTSRTKVDLPLHPQSQQETIYRRFFMAGILVILTAGALWGTYLLWQAGQSGSFTATGSIFAVNAHGHAQIFGWVGLFIMGFAYQAFPRMWGARLVGPHLAVATFLMMILGAGISTVTIFYAESWALAHSLVTIGGLLQIVAVITFAGQIAVTFKRSPEPISPSVGFIIMAMLFFIAMTIMNLWHTLALIQAESREALLAQIATYQAALRDLQIHGLAMFMILGVSMRFFPGMFGMARTPSSLGWFALFILSFAVIGEVVLLIAAQRTGSQALSVMLLAPWLMLLLGVGLIVLPWRLWRPFSQVHRSTKFIRTAYLWLGIALLMLFAMPGYMALHDSSFSHAYHGAVRHAITVGFVSLMIMGVAAKVVPALRGLDHLHLSPLWGPFILVNVGCALRVSMQIATDWHSAAFSIIAFSGALELAGLGWWGIAMIVTMLSSAGRRPATQCTCCEAKEGREHKTTIALESTT